MSSYQRRGKLKCCWVPEPSHLLFPAAVLPVSSIVHRVQPRCSEKGALQCTFVKEALPYMWGAVPSVLCCVQQWQRRAEWQLLQSAVTTAWRCVGLHENSQELKSAFPGTPRDLT